MRFTLEVRMIEERDLCPATPFLPEGDEYETYLSALVEDLFSTDVISGVKRSASIFQLETAFPMSLAELKAVIKPALATDITKNVRFVSLREE